MRLIGTPSTLTRNVVLIAPVFCTLYKKSDTHARLCLYILLLLLLLLLHRVVQQPSGHLLVRMVGDCTI